MPDESNEQGTVRYIRCPSCGMPNPGTSPTCGRCGNSLEGAETGAAPRATPPQPVLQQLTCAKCRKALPPGSKFCGFCGAPLPVSPPAQRVAPKAPIPTPKPVAPPPTSPPSAAPTPPIAGPARPAAVPQTAPSEGTVVFTGLHAPTIEARIMEVKPDGSTGNSTRVTKEILIGRENCDVTYPSDVLLSPQHAALLVREGKLFLRDLRSQNGTFVRQRQDSELTPGDVFLLGRELFRFTTQAVGEPPPSPEGTHVQLGAPKLQRGPVTAKLERITLTGEVVEEFSLDKPETTLGRTTGDLVFKNDPYMSGTHARIVLQSGRFILQDLKSRNGVYQRIRTEVELQNGDEFFLGEQIFRVELKVS